MIGKGGRRGRTAREKLVDGGFPAEEVMAFAGPPGPEFGVREPVRNEHAAFACRCAGRRNAYGGESDHKV